MINLKEQYEIAKDKAIELMANGLLKEYITHLSYMNKLKLKMIALK